MDDTSGRIDTRPRLRRSRDAPDATENARGYAAERAGDVDRRGHERSGRRSRKPAAR